MSPAPSAAAIRLQDRVGTVHELAQRPGSPGTQTGGCLGSQFGFGPACGYEFDQARQGSFNAKLADRGQHLGAHRRIVVVEGLQQRWRQLGAREPTSPRTSAAGGAAHWRAGVSRVAAASGWWRRPWPCTEQALGSWRHSEAPPAASIGDRFIEHIRPRPGLNGFLGWACKAPAAIAVGGQNAAARTLAATTTAALTAAALTTAALTAAAPRTEGRAPGCRRCLPGSSLRLALRARDLPPRPLPRRHKRYPDRRNCRCLRV